MHTGSYIDGEWYQPNSGRQIRNVNPADTRDVIAEFPMATAADTERAIDAAATAFQGWRKTPGPERGRVIWRAADIARRRVDEIAELMTREEGKIFKEARGEVLKGISLLEYNAGAGYRLGGKTLPSEARDTFTYTIRQPMGVVALIAPWNFPWAIPVWKSAPALVAGNAVLLKPASLTPATAGLLAEVYEEAGLPKGVFNVIVGSGSEVGEAMVKSARIPVVSFTGSNEIGSDLYVKAASRGAKVTCEMGGKNAVIVMPDCDLEKAAVAIRDGAFGSTGQRCTATSRVIAIGSTKDELVARLEEHARKMRVGSGLDADVDMGPAVDESQWKTDLEYIEVGKQEGARLVVGGNQPAGLEHGFYVEPTVFDNVTPDMRIFREEIFGPVLSVARGLGSGRSHPVRQLRGLRPHHVHLHPGHRQGDAFRGRRGDGHGPRERAHHRRRGPASLRRHQGHRGRGAGDVRGGRQFLYRAEDRLYQLFGRIRPADDTLTQAVGMHRRSGSGGLHGI